MHFKVVFFAFAALCLGDILLAQGFEKLMADPLPWTSNETGGVRTAANLKQVLATVGFRERNHCLWPFHDYSLTITRGRLGSDECPIDQRELNQGGSTSGYWIVAVLSSISEGGGRYGLYGRSLTANKSRGSFVKIGQMRSGNDGFLEITELCTSQYATLCTLTVGNSRPGQAYPGMLLDLEVAEQAKSDGKGVVNR